MKTKEFFLLYHNTILKNNEHLSYSDAVFKFNDYRDILPTIYLLYFLQKIC